MVNQQKDICLSNRFINITVVVVVVVVVAAAAAAAAAAVIVVIFCADCIYFGCKFHVRCWCMYVCVCVRMYVCVCVCVCMCVYLNIHAGCVIYTGCVYARCVNIYVRCVCLYGGYIVSL